MKLKSKLPQPAFVPSAAEIRRRCRAIQETWTPEVRRKRTVFKVEPWMVSVVQLSGASGDQNLRGRVA